MLPEVLTKKDIKIMREAGKAASAILKKIKKDLNPGISTKEIEILFDKYLERYREMTAAFKGYNGFPASICVSVNEEIIHGIPSPRIIQEGDIVSIDLGIKYKGLYVDTAYTYIVGKASKAVKKLVNVTLKALSLGIKKAKAGGKAGDISYAIQNFVEKNRFSVIRKFVGHGIGRNLHLSPEIPNFGKEGQGEELCEGMVIAIEPMVSLGGYEVDVLEDGWTAKTRDNSLSAHFEHTVAITKWGPKILTH